MLVEATRLVGSIENLSVKLGVKKVHLVAYGTGVLRIPQDLFLKLADVISEHKKT